VRKALLRRRLDLENEVRGLLKVYGVKLRTQIYHARFDKMAREAVLLDPALNEHWSLCSTRAAISTAPSSRSIGA
jgi:hypothetical protein